MPRLEPILSEDEVRALIDGRKTETGSSGVLVKAESVDLLADDRYIAPLLPMLEIGYARVAEALRRVLTSVLRSKVELRDEDPEILSGRGLLNVAEHAACLIVLRITSQEAEPVFGVLALDPTVTFSIIERLFGGGGGTPETPGDRSPTALERRMLLRALSPVVDVLNENLEPRGFLKFEAWRVESRLDLVPGYTPDAAAIHVPFTMTIGDQLASLSLATPAAAFEPLRGGSEVSRRESSRESGVGRVVSDVDVVVSVELGATELSLRRILQLSVGMVLPLDRPRSAELPVRVEGVTKFIGLPVEDDGAIAVELTARVGPPLHTSAEQR